MSIAIAAHIFTKVLAYLALLVPFLGELGVAASYSIGFLIALTAIPPSALKIGYRVNWLETIKILAIPTSLTIVLFFFNSPWVLALPILLLSSLLAYTRLRIVTKSDLLEVSQAFLSKESVSRMYSYTRPLIRLMYGE
ncbi:MAG: hypothetical protein HY619_07270 [Thaumarchaeota archaeon]|nr:hypothetical protein [Nitrososphaerota archaeon]